MLRLLIALAIFGAVMWVGVFFLRSLAQPVPAPPPPGEMRRVDLRYRCAICGAEMRMTLAAEEEPVAPRHCMEDMDPVALPD